MSTGSSSFQGDPQTDIPIAAGPSAWEEKLEMCFMIAVRFVLKHWVDLVSYIALGIKTPSPQQEREGPGYCGLVCPGKRLFSVS